ncbi:hypothetical protein [Paenibacillus sp. BK720]|uniref:hypothetical protein n=1 Tax=Paenibacillus sp. BK720 TaxID=2587092 RepID=UPI0014226B00|nr:hypothetical protein [Paenibacillus sp. BK720]NIK70602.1 hypothetical protein [Paenibacillus sp. BK720]
MKTAKRLTSIIVYGCLIIVIGIAAAAGIWYQQTEPLNTDGLSTFTPPDGKPPEYVVGLVNKGLRKIDIVSVTINGTSPSGPVQLGITYDSGQFVQVMPEPVPEIEFMGIHDSSIYPALSGHELTKAINKKAHTPILYGIRFSAEEGTVQSVTVKYKYLGFTKKLTVTRWFDNNH